MDKLWIVCDVEYPEDGATEVRAPDAESAVAKVAAECDADPAHLRATPWSEEYATRYVEECP